MTSLAGSHPIAPADAAPSRAERRPTVGAVHLEVVHRTLRAGADARAHSILDRARETASGAFLGAGADDAADRLAATRYVADVIAELAAEGILAADDTRHAVGALAEAREEPFAAAAFEVHARVASSPALLELPPLTAADIQLRLLLHLDVAQELSLWRRAPAGPEPVLVLGADAPSRRVRATAKSTLGQRTALSLVGGQTLKGAVVERFGEPFGALVARFRSGDQTRGTAYLRQAAAALGPVLERELLLDRNARRERELVSSGEKRMMRLGFDLHDGPIQDVLALGAEVTHLRDQIYPFILESHRERAAGRFDDVLARVTEVDRSLREIAHSLESKSVVSRPLAEILHREVESFAERTGIDARLDVRGDPESLTSGQRIAVFRAIQESLANVREHSGATTVEIRLRARRHSIEVRIVDDGHGFEVGRALAQAAQRGRLGIVGIGERVRMLGGTFEIDSAPGGPTTLSFSLPRATPS